MWSLTNLEPVLVAGLLAVVSFPLLVAARRFRRAGSSLALVACWLGVAAAVGVGAAVLRTVPLSEHDVEGRPIAVSADTYVSSDRCEACHPREYATWHRSYHRTMTQVATPDTVLGDFDDVELELDGHRYHLTQTDDALWVEMDDPTFRPGAGRGERASRVRRKVALTTGSHHDQNYWLEEDEGDRRLRILPFDFSRREGRWVPFRSTFVNPPNMIYPTRAGQWNRTCIRCHTTRPESRIAERGTPRARYDTHVTEFGIGCEACHGPGEEHVRSNRSPINRFAQYWSDDSDDSVVDPAKLDHERSAEICGYCHGLSFPRTPEENARWGFDPNPYRPGDDLDATRILFRPKYTDPRYPAEDEAAHLLALRMSRGRNPYMEGRYWSDGMVRISGRDYSGLIESPCFERGEVSCGSCHQMHQKADDPRSLDEWANDMLAVGMDGNGACLQCHAEFSADEALTTHTHHAAGSAGSSCYNCHMPYTVYGIQKAIRSHQVDSPDVAVSVWTGRPNACNQCHLDQPLAWAADRLQDWYGVPRPLLSGDDVSVSAGVKWALTGRAGQRALMAWSMGWDAAREAAGSEWMIPILAVLLDDPYDSVRFMAIRSLHEHEGFEGFDYDFIAPPDERRAAAQRLATRAAATVTKPAMASLEAVLRSPAGTIVSAQLERLRALRDDAPVNLFE